jgi:hypothetical protein
MRPSPLSLPTEEMRTPEVTKIRLCLLAGLKLLLLGATSQDRRQKAEGRKAVKSWSVRHLHAFLIKVSSEKRELWYSLGR